MKNQISSGGISFLGMLALIFITLKLCGVIAWSWWVVLLPLYGPVVVLMAVVLFVSAVLLAKK